MIRIAPLKTVSEAQLKDFIHLVSELRRNTDEHVGSLSDLEDIVNNKHAVMVVAQDDEAIIGMATLYIIVKVGKYVGYVEDVVVDSRYRGQGLGKKIMEAIVAEARNRKLTYLFLTSNAARDAANNLYQKLGFEIVETNPYKLRL